MIAQLDTVVRGLHASAPERLPFGSSLDLYYLGYQDEAAPGSTLEA